MPPRVSKGSVLYVPKNGVIVKKASFLVQLSKYSFRHWYKCGPFAPTAPHVVKTISVKSYRAISMSAALARNFLPNKCFRFIETFSGSIECSKRRALVRQCSTWGARKYRSTASADWTRIAGVKNCKN